jgi:hypothetical protein
LHTFTAALEAFAAAADPVSMTSRAWLGGSILAPFPTA